MGASVYIALEKQFKNSDALPVVDGKAIAKNMKKLTHTATKLGVKPLDVFVSVNQDELANLIGEDAVAKSGVELPKEQWFSASEGLTTIKKLLSHVETNKTGFDKPESLINDLKAVEKKLVLAKSKNIGFRLAWDF